MVIPEQIITELIEQKKILETFIEEKNKELQQINSALSSLQAITKNVIRYNWSKIALECIKKKDIFLQTTEIVNQVLDDNQELQDEKRKRNVLVGISIAVNNLCSKGFLRKIIIQGIKGHFYGLPDWIEDNHPKKKYIANSMMRYGKATIPLKLKT